MNKIGIIIQARTGSGRLPKKVLLPFYKGKSILELIVYKIKMITDFPIVIATTKNKNDDVIVKTAEKFKVKCFRGSENNVLQRFIDASDFFKFDNIIRICSDNPFLDEEQFKIILSQAQNLKNDYFSFKLAENKPVIKSHFGFWAELIKVSALKKILKYNLKKKHLEHVTIFLYENTKLFDIKLINVPENVFNRQDIRLTIDTSEDFIISQKIYTELKEKYTNFGINEIIFYLDNNKDIIDVMKKEILKNEKH